MNKTGFCFSSFLLDPSSFSFPNAHFHRHQHQQAQGQARDGRADPVGVGAIRTLRSGIAEVKRMYVEPGCRDRHVGSAILDRLLDEACEMGAPIVLLDTCRFMTEAHRLYRSRGFVERSPYEGTEIPARLQHLWTFFERSAPFASQPS